MRILLLLLFTCLVFSFSLAQKNSKTQVQRDSLRSTFVKDSINIYEPKKLTLYLALEFRNSYIGSRFLSFVGPQAGVNIRNKHIIGLGFNFLNKFSPFQSDKITAYSFEKIDFVSAFYQYILLDRKHFDVLIPVEFGYGWYKATEEKTGKSIESEVIPFSMGIRCVLLPHKWVGLKVGAGYNYVWEKNTQIGLDGLYFSLGIKIDLRQLYLDYRYFRLQQNHKHFLNAGTRQN